MRFRWRGEQVTRIENLSDIVFALALGMIVAADGAVGTVGALNAYVVGLVPITGAFATLLAVWNAHFVFFRRYGLADSRIVGLNACLLLIVLFTAYPLRFVYEALYAYVLASFGEMSRAEAMGLDWKGAQTIAAYFGAGYALVYACLAAMYGHASKRTELLVLTPTEHQLTLRALWRYRVAAMLGFAVVPAALLLPRLGAFAGFLTLLVTPIGFILARRFPLPGAAGADYQRSPTPARSV
nr:TMEM175 family protein [Parvularcula dongshanensis]